MLHNDFHYPFICKNKTYRKKRTKPACFSDDFEPETTLSEPWVGYLVTVSNHAKFLVKKTLNVLLSCD